MFKSFLCYSALCPSLEVLIRYFFYLWLLTRCILQADMHIYTDRNSPIPPVPQLVLARFVSGGKASQGSKQTQHLSSCQAFLNPVQQKLVSVAQWGRLRVLSREMEKEWKFNFSKLTICKGTRLVNFKEIIEMSVLLSTILLRCCH